ncbi:MAG: phage portal protein [Anaerolinea sp.]|nr:phage portal protein [Anaerolinea sp.]
MSSASAARARLLSIVPVDRAARMTAAPLPAVLPATTGRRRFEAAQVNRLTSSWRVGANTIDEDLRRDLDALRARSRDLCKNDAYAAKFLRMVRNNVVGAQGFVLQSAAMDDEGTPDAAANTAIENAWYRQCRPGNFEVTGRLSADDFWRSAVCGVARDGELLIRIVRGSGRGEFGFQLQLLDPARIDTNYNREPARGVNAIIMGVEVDDFRKPVAYHLFKSIRSNTPGRERERVPADEIIHQFIPWELEQSRGLPWMHAAMSLLRQLGGYREAAVIAARVGASKMGIYTRTEGAEPPNDGTDANGDFVTSAEPGTFEVAPDGYSLETWDPAYPHDQFDAFCKATLRGIASGIGVAYNSLGNDLEGVNFSSIRSGVLEEREEWMVIQSWLINTVLVPVYEQWLSVALMAGRIRLKNESPLPVAKIAKFREHTWQGRRWAWVDPLKDVQASVTAISNHLASPQQIAAQTGRDIVDVLDDLVRYQALLTERGLSPPNPGGTPNRPGTGEPAVTTDDE